MSNLSNESVHELSRLECEYKFFYLLRDIGIKSAHEPAANAWLNYMFILGQLSIGELCFS